MTAILDAILNISKRSMMPEWHHLDSSSTMPQPQESTKKKTLNQVPGHSGFLPDYLVLLYCRATMGQARVCKCTL